MQKEKVTDHLITANDKTYFSFDLFQKLLKDYELNHSQATVYMAIMDRLAQDPKDNAITLDYIVEATKLSKTTVFNAVILLQRKGLVKHEVPKNTNRRAARYDATMAV